MNRRELIKHIALLTGTAFVGSEYILSGCKPEKKEKGFSAEDIGFLDEVAETIIPRTDTPGARDAAVGSFMARYSADCYSEEEQKALKDGIGEIDKRANEKFGSGFLYIKPEQREELLTLIDAEAKKNNTESKAVHYFTLMKQMTILGFFTSEPGATKVLRFVPMYSTYDACIDYHPGETAWSRT